MLCAYQHPDQRSISQPHQGLGDGIEQRACLLGGEDGRLAPLHGVPGSLHHGGAIAGHHLADHQPVEQHAHGGQALLDRGGGMGLPQLLDIGGHVHTTSSRRR
jgi:hypothetical protein